jgi:hypothetical protein
MMTMDDEVKIMSLLRRSADPAQAFEIALKLAMMFIVPPGSRKDGATGKGGSLSEP